MWALGKAGQLPTECQVLPRASRKHWMCETGETMGGDFGNVGLQWIFGHWTRFGWTVRLDGRMGVRPIDTLVMASNSRFWNTICPHCKTLRSGSQVDCQYTLYNIIHGNSLTWAKCWPAESMLIESTRSSWTPMSMSPSFDFSSPPSSLPSMTSTWKRSWCSAPRLTLWVSEEHTSLE